MSYTKQDLEYFSGWEDGYAHAIEDARQKLLELQAKGEDINLKVYMILNTMRGN
jgi:hypothetical protein